MEILYNIFIFPIYLIIEFLFNLFFNLTKGDIFICILIVSFFVNLICLPMYNSAEALQQKERETQKKLQPIVDKIKKNFKGDERFMLLSTYYKQNNYHPILSLRTSLSLLIQIPFFSAAYIYFSNLDILKNHSLFCFQNLGEPDNLFNIFGFSVNLLPILMTLINILSAKIYSKNMNKKDKIQMYFFAFIFLILLYNSPSGLVIYWTLNNLFSLIKNIGLKTKSPKAFLAFVVLIMGIIAGVSIFKNLTIDINSISFRYLWLYNIFILIFALIYFTKTHLKADFKTFLLSNITFFIWSGLLITSLIIGSSPTEFGFIKDNNSPFAFIGNTFFEYLGLCFWIFILYYFSKPKLRNWLNIISAPILFCVVYNSILSVLNIGTIPFGLTISDNIIDIENIYKNFFISILFILAPLVLIYKGKLGLVKKLITILLVSSILYSTGECIKIEKEYRLQKEKMGENIFNKEKINLSKKEKNVLIIMLDGGVNNLAREVFEDNKDLKENYRGFVLYPNTISYFEHTILGYPPLMGGYEYTPFELDKRENEKMVDKYNEAISVLPLIFSKQGYKTLIINPKDPDFQSNSSGEKFYGEKGITSYRIQDPYFRERYEKTKKNFFKFNLFIDSPIIIKLNMREKSFKDDYTKRELLPLSMQDIDLTDDTLSSYIMLKSMPELIAANEAKKGSFTIFHNNTLHDYTDNHYIVMEETLKALVLTFEKMKKNDVFNNTRIIIVADHGRRHKDNRYLNKKYLAYNPLLMVKDFNSNNEFKIDFSLMTNADTPIIAAKDLIEPLINPYSKKDLKKMVQKDNIKILTDGTDTFDGARYSVQNYSKENCIFSPSDILKIENNIFEEKNWKKERFKN